MVLDTMERLTLTVDEAAVLLGVSRNSAYESIRSGEFPVTPIRVGKRILIPKQRFLKALGIEEDDGEQGT